MASSLRDAFLTTIGVWSCVGMISLPGHLQVVKGGSCFSPREVRGTRRRLSCSHRSARGLHVPRSTAMAPMAKRSIFSVTMRAREPKSLFKRLDTPLNAQCLRPPPGRWEMCRHGGEQRKECSSCISMFASCKLYFLLPGKPVLSPVELFPRLSPYSGHPKGSEVTTMGT